MSAPDHARGTPRNCGSASRPAVKVGGFDSAAFAGNDRLEITEGRKPLQRGGLRSRSEPPDPGNTQLITRFVIHEGAGSMSHIGNHGFRCDSRAAVEVRHQHPCRRSFLATEFDLHHVSATDNGMGGRAEPKVGALRCRCLQIKATRLTGPLWYTGIRQVKVDLPSPRALLRHVHPQRN